MMSDVQALVDALAAELGRPVGVDDRRFRAVAYSSHPEQVDRVRVASILRREAPERVRRWLQALEIEKTDSPIRVPANPELGMAARVCVPLRFDKTLLGYLWLIDEPGSLSNEELAQALRYSEDLTVGLHRGRGHDVEERDHELVATLLSEQAPTTGSSIEDPLTSAKCYSILALTATHAESDPAHMEAVRAHLADAADQLRREVNAGQLLADLTTDPIICVLACGSSDEVERRASSLARAAEGRLADNPSWRVLVGRSAEVDAKNELSRAADQARDAIRIALTTGHEGPIVYWEVLGAYRVISGLLGPRDASQMLPASLKRLLDADDAAILTSTLERYLDLGGDARAAAESLFIHRSTLYGRLHKIEEVADVDLASGDERLELHLGLRLRRLSGSGGAS